MCGILGVYGEVGESRFQAALALMAHRGPDAHQCFFRGRVSLGHRRLSIIDLREQANQPMVSSDGSHVIVYNGEVYNYRELRRELETLGCHFRTDSDTEVVLNAFVTWGEEALTRFNGMFALAVANLESGDMFLARDRLGIKPLYYLAEEGRFSFASEVKALLRVSEARRRLAHDVLFSYLYFRYPVSGHSFFEGIEVLPPGHCAWVRKGQCETPRRYWDLRGVLGSDLITDADEAVERVREVFSSAVQLRTIADVPIGAYLSGGVDSSAVVAEMASRTTEPVRTYTIGFEEDDFNEFEYSRVVAERYGTMHREILTDFSQYVDGMRHLIGLKDAPLGVPNEVPLHLMSCQLKQDITVVLSGEGADEIFGGYGRIFRSADDLPLLRRWKAGGEETTSALGRRLRERYGKPPKSQLEHFLSLYRYTSSGVMSKLFREDALQSFEEGPTIQRFSEVFSEAEGADYATQMMYVFEKLHLPGLLQRVDVTTMGTSVEARVPFVDHRLVELAFRISPDLKLRWKDGERPTDVIGSDASETYDTPKWVLKEAMRPLLPESILFRKKVGFPVPLTRWFAQEHSRQMTAKIEGGQLCGSGIVDRSALSRMVGDADARARHSRLLWMLYNLEIFFEEYPDLEVAVS